MKIAEDIFVIRGLVSGYYPDVDIIKGIDLDVGEGEIVCIIGPNGAGKSTFLKTTFGLLEAREGSVKFHGEDITNMKPSEIVKAGISYVPQEKNVFSSLTIQENLEMGAFIREEGMNERLEEVYGLFPDLLDRKDDRAGQLSGGMRHMLAMARAMMLDPDILLLDEPTAGLAPKFFDMVYEKIDDINRSGASLVIVEQNARKALTISDRGYVFDMGRNVYEGEGKSLLEDEKIREFYLGK